MNWRADLDQMPKDGTQCLIRTKGGDYDIVASWKYPAFIGGRDDDGDERVYGFADFTHWCEIVPPEVKG